MATQEFYIRTASETEAHGPFTQEQLVSLAEAGKVDPQTLYYEATTEQWVAIGSNLELKAQVFPEKKRLTIKPKDRVATLNDGPDTSPPITVTDMLAAAEGRTSETKGKADKTEIMEKAARLGRYATIVMLLISAISLLLPSIDVIAAMEWGKLVYVPYVYLGAVDFILVLVLLLGAVSAYPFIRFRAMLGIGFLGLIFWSQGQLVPVIAVAAGSIGIYLTTVFVSYVGLGLSVGLGLAGMIGFAYYMLT
ncbi:MAG TPA: GYF domain-containing protein [Opitutaceae bacterium]|nr:GYF domain-containing protein [Opitutaceae bacterium]